MHAKLGGTTGSTTRDDGAPSVGTAVGKQSLVDSLAGFGQPGSAAQAPTGVVRAFGLSADAAGAANPAAAAIAGKGAGQSLPGPVAETAARAYGESVSDVRVHNDTHAHSAAGALGAEAFTHGNDVFLGSGHQPNSPHGQFVMMHELAHVVQGRGAEPATQAKLEVGASSDPAEHEADHAADRAMQGGTTTIARREGRLRRFEAGTVKYDPKKPKGHQYSVEEGGHAFLTVKALETMGLGTDQAAQGYQGNWMRDLSQVFVPGLTDKIKATKVMPILQIISIKEFGKGFNEQEFGTYDPVEHIDNPTDLRASDVFQQYERNPDGTPKGVDGNKPIPLARVVNVGQGALDNPHNFDDPSKALTPSGAENQAFGDVDARYKATAAKTPDVINKADALPFQMNATAVPNYINTSKEWSKSTLRQAAMAGRDNAQGPRDFGSGIHTMQDYYAHSNFCEVSINTLIKEGRMMLTDDRGKVAQVDRSLRVDSKVKKNGADGEPLSSVNMRVKDLPGFKGSAQQGDREVISTGSFNLTDTAVSLLYVMKDKVLELNPFATKQPGPSPLANAALDYLDMEKPDGFNKTGKRIAAILHPLGDAIKAAGDGAGSVVSGTGHAAGGAVKGAGAVGGGFFGMLNKTNAMLGGSEHYWDQEKQSVEGSANATGNSIIDSGDAKAAKIREVTSWLDRKATEYETKEHILRDVYAWMSGIDLLAPIKAMARSIPVVGTTIGELIDEAQKQLHAAANAILSELWIAATKQITGKIQGVIEWLKERTNIKDKKQAGKKGGTAGPDVLPDGVRRLLGDKKGELERMFGGVGDMYGDDGKPKNGNAIAPTSYTPPSHSEVAKDHHAKDAAVQAAAEPKEAEGPDGADVDGGDWLNSLAEKLALAASTAIGGKVARAWDEKRDTGNVSKVSLDAIDAEVEHYFRHPDDCRDTWERPTLALFNNPAFAARLRKEISKGNH